MVVKSNRVICLRTAIFTRRYRAVAERNGQSAQQEGYFVNINFFIVEGLMAELFPRLIRVCVGKLLLNFRVHFSDQIKI